MAQHDPTEDRAARGERSPGRRRLVRTARSLVRGARARIASRPALGGLAAMRSPLGALREFRADQIGTLERVARNGDAVSFRLLHHRLHVVTDPDRIEHVLVKGAKVYGKQVAGYETLQKMLGTGLLTSEGAFWRRQRRIAQPAFRKPRIEAFGDTMVQAAENRAAAWRDGQTIDLEREMMQITLRVAGLTLFSRDVSAEADEFRRALDVGLAYVNFAKETPWMPPLWVPTRQNVRFREAVRTFDRVVGSIIAERREARRAKGAGGDAAAPDDGDLLDILMDARDPDTGESMSDGQLRDEVMTIITAGHETTGAALTWALDLIGRHPEVEAALDAELVAVLGGRTPTVADLPALPYTERVILEAMRLYPPAWMFARSVHEDDDICGYQVAAGDWVILSPWLTHRRADLFPDPLRFDPDRFSPAQSAGRHRYAYFPFAGGQRKCIGDRFALTEARLVLATLLQRARLRPLSDAPPSPIPQVTLRPSQSMPARVERAGNEGPDRQPGSG